MTVRLFESEICECLCFITIVTYSLEVSMMKPLTLDAYCFFLGSSFWRGRGERFCADVFCLSLSNKEVGTNGFWAIELVLSASWKRRWPESQPHKECKHQRHSPLILSILHLQLGDNTNPMAQKSFLSTALLNKFQAKHISTTSLPSSLFKWRT